MAPLLPTLLLLGATAAGAQERALDGAFPRRPTEALACPPGSCGGPVCSECCHKGRCCKQAKPPSPCPAPAGPPPPPGPKCLLPAANFPAGGKPRCCQAGSIHKTDYNRPCDDANFSASHAFCNMTLGHAARIDDILSRMSVAEKLQNMNSASATPSSNLHLYNWWSEGTHGVAGTGSRARSQFAMPITTAQSFNRSLWRATGAQIGRESAALNNMGEAWSTYWAPVVNLARSPRWGRNLETPGEDSYLSAQVK